MKAKLALFLSPVILLVGFVVYAYATAPSDSQKIKTALNEQIKAAKEGKPGPVLEYLSRNFNYGGESFVDRNEVAKIIKMAQPDVVVVQPDPIVTGDKAVIVSPVQLKIEAGPFPMNSTLPKVTIGFRREAGTMFGILPTSVWRMSSLQADDLPSY